VEFAAWSLGYEEAETEQGWVAVKLMGQFGYKYKSGCVYASWQYYRRGSGEGMVDPMLRLELSMGSGVEAGTSW
jgi:hypothetical protein